jgi:1-acyl-sn-glycerol-3-phosphate acyltransferase
LTQLDSSKRTLRSRLWWLVSLPLIRLGARILWGLRVDRGPGFPSPPFVLAANHHSFLDPALVGAVYGKRARFIALIDLYGNHRPLDWALDSWEAITVRRGAVPLGTVRQCLDHLESGGVVGLFPEGIRVERFGDAGFKRGAAWLAARTGVPLVAVAVNGTDQVLGIDNKFRKGKVEVIIGPALHPTGTDRSSVDDLTRRWAQWVGDQLSQSESAARYVGPVPGLEYITEEPPNAAVPLAALDGSPIPQDRAYLRNSFPIPKTVTAEVEVLMPGRPTRTLSTGRLSELDQVEMEMVLECAGNGRSMVRPVVSGLEWGLGGASPIRIGGVRLIDALGIVPDEVVELVLTGSDRGTVWPEGDINYQFSVPIDRVQDGSALLVTRWGNAPLGIQHGGPIRFVLPGHYAMRSVKWLAGIEGVIERFAGHFVQRYRYLGDHRFEDASPVAEVQLRSVIAQPGQGDSVPAGAVVVMGSAWSGGVPVAEVGVSMDRGQTWQTAELAPGSGPLAAVAWRHEVVVDPGRHAVMARATDSAGNRQPMSPPWNKNGYANNMIHTVEFDAR